MDKITSRPIQCFKKGDAFVEMAPRPLVFMEVNEVKVPQNYTNENGGKTGGKFGGDVALIEITDFQKGIIDLIGADASISIDQMAVKLAVKKRTLEREIANMKQKGYISRTGSPRSGKWEVIIPYNCVIEIM